MTGKATQVLADWRHQFLDDLASGLPGLLDHSIDRLMSHAESAENNQLQTLFFHAQQELRRDKDAVATTFLAKLDELMHQPPSPAPHQWHIADDLGLVNIDEFERNVAIQRFTDRAIQEHYPLLHQLTHRLSVVQGGTPVREDDIPGGPSQLLSALDQAITPLKLERLATKVIYADFDKAFMRAYAGQRYEALNRQLRDAGILPNLQFQVVQKGMPVQGTWQPPAENTAPQTAHQTPEAQPNNTPVNGDMTAIVQQIRDLLPSSQPGHAGAPAASLSSGQVAQLIDKQRHFLTEMLPEHGVFGTAGSHVALKADQLAESLKALIRQRHEIKRMIGHDKLSVYDESTLDIVGALFEIMLNDHSLSDAIKALFSHLHTPYLKLALRERDLLSDTAHPGRKLLDELVEAGEAWGTVDQLGDGIFPVLQDIVEVLRSADSPDSTLIEQQREYLGRRVETLYKRQQLRIRRTRDTEIGRARLDQAKQKAEMVITTLIAQSEHCPVCCDFLSGPWHDYLTLLLLRNNCLTQGEEWQQADELGLRIADLASRLGGTEPLEGEELDSLQVALAAQIGPFLPHYTADVEKLLTSLRSLNNGGRAVSHKLPRTKTKPLTTPRLHPGDELELNTTEKRTAEHLRKVRAGTRFRIPTEDGQGSQLVTLTWFNAHTDRLLFVDGNGSKAALLPVQRLARYLHSGQAQLANQKQQPFFSRAIKALKDYLEKRMLPKQELARA